MLFDLRSGKRRRMVQVVYSLLAASFLIGFVIFGVGSGGIGSLSDLFSGGGGGSSSSAFDPQINHAKTILNKDPQNEQALASLASNEYRLGTAQIDPTQPANISTDAQSALSDSVDAWSRYLNVANKPDPALAGQIAQAYAFLNDAQGAAKAQRILADAEPSTRTLGYLAIYLYFAGNFKAGDAAAAEAVAKAPKGQAQSTKSQLDQKRSDAQTFVKAQKKAAKASSAGGSSAGQLQNPFGGVAPSGTPTTP